VIRVELPTPDDTRAWGRALAGVLRPGDLVVLTGELGAGKTTLVQGLASALGVAGRVASPTFIMARQHRPLGQGPWLIHADAYRLASIAELDTLDLDASLDQAITVVEWGQGVVEDLTPDRLEVHLHRERGTSDGLSSGLGDAEPRTAQASGVGERWAGIVLPDLSR